MAQNFNTVNIGYNFMHFSIRKKRNNKDFRFNKQNSSVI